MTNENNKELVEIIQSNGIVLTEAESIVTCFGLHMSEAKKLIESADGVTVKDENDTEGMKKAREIRLALAKIRTDAEKDRKSFKDGYLKKGRAIDQIAGMVEDLTTPIEKTLDSMEKTAVRVAAEKKEAEINERYKARLERLKEFRSPGTGVEEIYGLKEMPNDAFEQLFQREKEAFEARERKADEERAAKEKAELEKIEEDKRIREENERMKREQAERDEKDRIEREKREAEEKHRLEKERIEREETERKLAEEKAKREEAERVARETKEKAEREEKERLEKIRQEQEAKEKADREAMELEERHAKERALAPDKVKLSRYADSLMAVECEDLATDDAKGIKKQAMEHIAKAIVLLK